jgi:hypothetical protein
MGTLLQATEQKKKFMHYAFTHRSAARYVTLHLNLVRDWYIYIAGHKDKQAKHEIFFVSRAPGSPRTCGPRVDESDPRQLRVLEITRPSLPLHRSGASVIQCPWGWVGLTAPVGHEPAA